MAEAYIIDAVRTPRGIGKPGKGALSHLHPQHLAATVLAAIRDRNGLDTATVDDVIWSTSSQVGKQGGDLGRMAALDAGYAITASGTTLDRFCGGGITSVNLATASVMSGPPKPNTTRATRSTTNTRSHPRTFNIFFMTVSSLQHQKIFGAILGRVVRDTYTSRA